MGARVTGEQVQDIRLGLIGYGFAGATFHAPLIAAVRGLRLTRVASSNAAKVLHDYPDVQVDASPRALMTAPDVDVVVIATPNESHVSLAREALLAGKHVVIDKPFTLSSDGARALMQLARERELCLSAFHNRRWDSDFLTVRSVLASGELGRVHTFRSTLDRYRPQVRVRWREQSEIPGAGTLWDLGPHLIDQVLVLFGLPATVWADAYAQRPGASAVDCFQVVLGYRPMRAVLQSGLLVRQPGPRFEIHGEHGSLVKHGTDVQEDALRAGRHPGGADWGVEPPLARATLTVDRDGQPVASLVETQPGTHHAYYAGLRDSLIAGTPPPVSAEDALKVVSLIECALRSVTERRVVDVEGG